MAMEEALTLCFSSIKALFLMASITILIKILFSQQNRAKQNRLPLPPGPIPWPIVGSLPWILLNKPAYRWMHSYMSKMRTEIACFRLGGNHVITVTCPEIALQFLKKQDAAFASRPLTFASQELSGGYLQTALSPHGDQWKKMRRVLTSEILNTSTHRWLHDKRADEADNLVRYIFHQCKTYGKDVNLRLATRHYCGNVIRRLVFNKRYFGERRPDGSPGENELEHVDALFTALGHLYAFCISDYFPWLVGFDLDGHERVVKRASEIINKYQDPIINERIKSWRQGEPKENEGDVKDELQDYLDVLITLKTEDGKPLLSIEEIKAQCQDFLMAAVDNPSNAVEWALAEMINRPEILRKAVKELDTVVGKERLVQESDMPQLNYLKGCLREAFRLHPIAPFNVPHVAMSSASVAGYSIPKGSVLLLSRLGLGRNPKVWDNPLEFRPERHLNQAEPVDLALTEPNLRFISFSTGRRGCVGSVLGSTMTVMLFARILQGFTWTKPAGVTTIRVNESNHDMFLAKPLVLHAEPRLPVHLYPII